MDRRAFLNALPFLSPISLGKEWPPHSIHGSCEVILKNYKLSVEPAGPALFAHGEDSALFSIDVCIMTTSTETHAQGKGITSPDASSVSTSLSLSQTSKQPSQEHVMDENKSRMHILLNLDNACVFQVHLALLCRVELHEQQEDNNISHILLEFDSCSFRVFSQDDERSSGSSNNGSPGTLKTAVSRLKKATAAFEKRPILQEHEEYLLPMAQNTGDTASSAIDTEAQRQSGNDDTEGASKTNEESSTSSVRRIKRKRSSLGRSWDELHALQAMLNMPRDAVGEEGAAETIAPILNKSAEELASSYCQNSDLRSALQSYTNEISSCEAQLNNVFAAGFPPPTRNRRHASPAKTTMPEEDTETLLETAQTLLKKQKAAMKERLELSLLPTRG